MTTSGNWPKHVCPFVTVIDDKSKIVCDKRDSSWVLKWDFPGLGQIATIPVRFCPFCGAELLNEFTKIQKEDQTLTPETTKALDAILVDHKPQGKS